MSSHDSETDRSVVGVLVRGLATAGGQAGGPLDGTQRRILDAAVQEAAARGVSHVTVEAVARRAGVNRATVYRHFGDRDGLVDAAVLREGRHVARDVAAAVAAIDDPRGRFVEGFVAAIRIAREHPLLERVAKLEPESLIAGIRANDGALLRFGAAFTAAGLRAAGGGAHVDPDQAGEILTRLFAAFILFPSMIAIDLRDDDSVRTFVRDTLAPMALGPDARDT